MGIVAAQCWVFITQNDICAPRPLYYHLFFLDNRRVPASSHLRRLPDSLPLSSIPPAFHVPYRLSTRSPSRQASCLAAVFAIRWRFRIAFRASPVPFLRASLSFSRPFPVYPRRLRSRNRGGRGIPYHPTLGVPCHCSPSLCSPSRSPARWARRVVFRGVGRRGRRGVLWDVSRGTGRFPVHFSMLYKCHSCYPTGMSGIPVRWMNAVPCRHHAKRGVPYIAVCGIFRPSPSVCRLAVKRYRPAYMFVPPLFPFLGGSGSGTASEACIGLFVGIMTLAGIGEAAGDI